VQVQARLAMIVSGGVQRLAVGGEKNSDKEKGTKGQRDRGTEGEEPHTECGGTPEGTEGEDALLLVGSGKGNEVGVGCEIIPSFIVGIR